MTLSMNWARRRFSAFIFLLVMSSYGHASDKIELVYFGDKRDTAFLGVGQGLEDSNTSGSTAAKAYRLKIVAADNIRLLENPKPEAIIAAADAESLYLLSTLNPDVPIFNLIESHDRLRQMCQSNLLHVIPSEQMRADAVQQWQRQFPDSEPVAQAWHPHLDEHGAAELNHHFRDKRSFDMTEQAWAGWVAARLYAAARHELPGAKPVDILQFLKTGFVFDGRKSQSVSFRANGQMQQVMLLVENERLVGEVQSHDKEMDSPGHDDCP